MTSNRIYQSLCAATVVAVWSIACPVANAQVNSPYSIEASQSAAAQTHLQILAAGSEGGERMSLRIDGKIRQTWEVGPGASSGTFGVYEYFSGEPLSIQQVEIVFDNDVYDPDNGIDRNLRVDAVLLDKVRYETEDVSVFSTGTWIPALGVQPGFHENEVLHTDGFIRFSEPKRGSEILMRASGDAGGEAFQLQIDEQVVSTFTATQGFIIFHYQAANLISPNQVRVVFTNDEFDPDGTIDRNLNVDWIQIDDVRIQTENSNVFSTGTYRPEDGVVPGFGRGETLHANGYFQYDVNLFDGDPSTIVIRASGDIGVEMFELLIDEQPVASFVTTTEFQEFVYVANDTIAANRVRVRFTNDIFDPEFDRNLNVDWVQIDGTIFETEDDSVFSTGTFTAEDGIQTGFGRGETLHVQGYFEYGRVASDRPFDLNGQPVFYRNRKLYLLTVGASGWTEALVRANALGGHIVTVNSEVEEAFLKRIFGSNALWIGINDLDVEGQFQWSSGESVFYSNWNPGEPDNDNLVDNFGLMNTQEQLAWEDADDGQNHFAIVEIHVDF